LTLPESTYSPVYGVQWEEESCRGKNGIIKETLVAISPDFHMNATFSPADSPPTKRDGFFIARGLFDQSEISKLLDYAKNRPGSPASSMAQRCQRQERSWRLGIPPAKTSTACSARSPRVVDRMEQALGARFICIT
jgi:hypothetical protein